MLSLLLACLVGTSVVSGKCLNSIVLFGDSLSDDGDGDGQLFGGKFPIPPYYKFHFTNGPVWVEHLPVKDLFDYAYGGAVINNSAVNNGPPSLMAQVNDYLISQHFNVEKVADETQYIHFGGSNDVFDALASNDPSTALTILTFSLPALTAFNIGKLVKAGAKHILVFTIPTWSNSPFFLATASDAQRASINQFTNLVNEFIMGNVSAVVPANVDLKFFDTVGFTQSILDHPENFGLVNTTGICLQNFDVFINGTGGQAPIVCPNPDEFFFWDVEHPTAKVHGFFGAAVQKLLDWY